MIPVHVAKVINFLDGCRELELGAPVAVGDVFDAKHICAILCNCWCYFFIFDAACTDSCAELLSKIRLAIRCRLLWSGLGKLNLLGHALIEFAQCHLPWYMCVYISVSSCQNIWKGLQRLD